MVIEKVFRKGAHNSRVQLANGQVGYVKSPLAVVGRVLAQDEFRVTLKVSAEAVRFTGKYGNLPLLEFTREEKACFAGALRSCLLKLLKNGFYVEDIEESYNNLYVSSFDNPTISNGWLHRYRGLDKSLSDHIGYLYSSVKGRLFNQFRSEKRIRAQDEVYRESHKERLIGSTQAAQEGIVVQAIISLWDDKYSGRVDWKFKEFLVTASFKRLAYLNEGKEPPKVSVFEAKRMGYTVDQAEQVIDEFVVALKKDMPVIKQLAIYLKPQLDEMVANGGW
jgi:hypothetical protein